MANAIQVYGTDWCGLTFSVREFLMKSRIPYDYYDIEQDPSAEEFVRTVSDGRRRFPLVLVDEEIIMNPTLKEVQRVLSEQRVSPLSAGRNSGPRISSLALENV
jgi:mycoredoxin